MSTINQFCLAFCVVMIFLAVVLSLVMVWGGIDSVVAWKGLATIVILFSSAAAIGGVAQYFGRK